MIRRTAVQMLMSLTLVAALMAASMFTAEADSEVPLAFDGFVRAPVGGSSTRSPDELRATYCGVLRVAEGDSRCPTRWVSM